MLRQHFVRVVSGLALAAFLAPPAPAQSGNLDIDLVGGGYNQLTSLSLKGTPGRKFMLLVSVVKAPGLNYIPNQTVDVGIEFLGLSLGLPGFTGIFNGAGQASAALFVPYFPELDVFPLYFQLFETGATGNKLADKSVVQTLSMQAATTWKPPKVGTNYAVNRGNHTLTLLPGERVLTVGGGMDGISTSYGQDTAEIYDLSDESLTLLAGTMVQPRTGHSATLLNDGRVLIVGGAEDVLGEPTEETTISIIGKEGSSAGIPSRIETDHQLKGTKRIIVREGNVYIGKGRKDGRSILIIPVISVSGAGLNMIRYLYLLEIAFKEEVPLSDKIKALGGKYERIKNIVQENSVAWEDPYLDRLAMDELFGNSAEKIGEKIVNMLGS
jgi:hypothetical protein